MRITQNYARPLDYHTAVTQSLGYTLIIGGAGFIGSNLADTLLSQGRRVLVFDNLARPGVERNLRWLQQRHGNQLLVQIDDLGNPSAVTQAVAGATAVFHLGAQVAVTTSLTDPLADFAVNAQGTLHLLEALRTVAPTVPLIFTSTNKVYGDLDDLQLTADGARYAPTTAEWRNQGINEQRPLAFHSPYGCSKGAADQYVLDYAHTFGLPTVVFRMSCIYGARQFGTEDQGWLAHFLIRAEQGEPITIYGDGKQVRDVLYVDDLIRAFLLAEANIATVRGQAFNMGGGPANTVSLLELLDLIAQLRGAPVERCFAPWRPGDQRWYVSDSRKFQAATGWQPTIDVNSGLARLYTWIQSLCTDAVPAATGERHAAPHSPSAVLGCAKRPLPSTTNGHRHTSASGGAKREEFVYGD
jgi:CDP-paratose 2-epimerase